MVNVAFLILENSISFVPYNPHTAKSTQAA